MTPATAPAAPPTDDAGPHCPECDYPLSTLTEPRCPWCGWAFDANVLAATRAERGRGSTWAVFVASLVCGAGACLSIVSLLRGGSKLAVWDGLAVIAVAIAVAGHFALAGVLLAVQLHRMLPRHLRSPLLRFAAVLSIGLGLIAASRTLQPRPASGAPVETVLEFVLVATLFTLPGWTLMALHAIARNTRVPSLLASRANPRPAEFVTARSPFLIDLDRPFAITEVVATMGKDRRESTAAIDAAIERVWRAEVAIAAEERRVLYDGKLGRLGRWTAEDDRGASQDGWHGSTHQREPVPFVADDPPPTVGQRGRADVDDGRRRHGSVLGRTHATQDGIHSGDRLTLELGETSYREFIGTNVHDAGGVKLLGPNFLANPLGISALVTTRDGYLCLGRRGSAVALHRGMLHTFGGMIERGDWAAAASEVDVTTALARELKEELGLDATEWSDATVLGIVRDRALQQPELLFDVAITRSRSELIAGFSSRGPDPEHMGWEFAHDDTESLLAWLDSASPIAPVAEAALLLHGRHAWGEAWYEHACYLRYGAIPSL